MCSLYFGFVTFFPWGTFHDGKVTGAFSIFRLHLLSLNFSFPCALFSLPSSTPSPLSLVLYFYIACRITGNPSFFFRNTIMSRSICVSLLRKPNCSNLVKDFKSTWLNLTALNKNVREHFIITFFKQCLVYLI